MSARKSAKCRFETAADLLARLGNIPPNRVRLNPPPGRATKWDLIRFRGPGQYELIDRVLVSKGISPYRGYLVAELSCHLGNAIERAELVALFGPGAWVEVLPGAIRNPDVTCRSFRGNDYRTDGFRRSRSAGTFPTSQWRF
jgi:hypothetical protein